MNKKKSKVTLVLIITVLIISIGYAALSTVFKINSTIGISKIEFNIIFDNVTEVAANATVAESAHISDDNNKEISFNVNFAELDQYYTFTTDIKNQGSIPGKIKTIEITGISDSLKKLISYDVTYTLTGEEVEVGDFIGPGSSKNITINVKYQLGDNATNDDVPQDNISITPVLTINYENGSKEEYRETALASKLVKNKTVNPSTVVNLSAPTNSEEIHGIFMLDSTKDDTFPVYFYRGSTNEIENYVIFANYCWRIVRTTENGGVKLIYHGGTYDGAGTMCTLISGDDVTIGKHTYGSNTWTWHDSYMKTWLNTWYYEHIKDYQQYLEDTVFCNDTHYEDGDISMNCSEENKVTVANGKNTYPIGLIAAEEANLAGLSNSASSYSWLYTGRSYWTISASNVSNYVLLVYSNGSLYRGNDFHDDVSHGNWGVRPVISLNSEVEFVSGNGKNTNPYMIKMN